jgi:hypothetical protein
VGNRTTVARDRHKRTVFRHPDRGRRPTLKLFYRICTFRKQKVPYSLRMHKREGDFGLNSRQS